MTRCLQLIDTASQGLFGNFHITTNYFWIKTFILSPCCILEKKSSYNPNLQCAVHCSCQDYCPWMKNPVEGRNFVSHWRKIKRRYGARKLNGLDLSLRKNPLLFAWQHPSKNLVNNDKNTENSSNCGVSCSKY